MLNLELTGLYMLAVVSLLATPGPVTLLVIRAGLAGGMRHALRTIAGTNAASLVLIAVSALVIKGLLVISPAAFSVVRLLGCLYLVWIAWGMLGDMRQPAASTEAITGVSTDIDTQLKAAPAGFRRGFALAISNPKDIIFFASFLPQFMGVLPHVNQSLGLLTLLWIVLDFATLGLLAYVVRSVAGPALQRKLIGGASIVLLLIGVVGAGYALYELYELWGM